MEKYDLDQNVAHLAEIFTYRIAGHRLHNRGVPSFDSSLSV
jgi:hypothetical protein